MRNMVPFNQALLGKWLWCFRVEDNNIWRCDLAAKFGVGLVVGRPKMSKGLMDVVFERILRRVGMLSPNILSLWLVWGIGFGFGRISGVGIFLLETGSLCILPVVLSMMPSLILYY